MHLAASDIERNLKDSRAEVVRVVWPALQPAIGGTISPVEGEANATLRSLDCNSGVDYLHVRSEASVFMATRLQWTNGTTLKAGYRRSHTLRYQRPHSSRPAEYWLLKKQLATAGAIVPHLHLHAYVRQPRGRGALLGAAVVRTSDLVSCLTKLLAEHGEQPPVVHENKQDGVLFGCITWKAMREAGYPMVLVEPNDDMFGTVPEQINGGAARLWTRL